MSTRASIGVATVEAEGATFACLEPESPAVEFARTESERALVELLRRVG